MRRRTTIPGIPRPLPGQKASIPIRRPQVEPAIEPEPTPVPIEPMVTPLTPGVVFHDDIAIRVRTTKGT